MNRSITDIVERIGDILSNPSDASFDQVGSYIVGATLSQDDTETYYEDYPLLEEIAELSAELETMGGSSHAEDVHRELVQKFQELQTQLGSRR